MNQAVAFGKAGGVSRSALKSAVACQNARLRWHHAKNGVLPMPVLLDGAWYSGRGKSTNTAVWDQKRNVFLSVVTNPNPELVRERHVDAGGSFAPASMVAAPPQFEQRTQEIWVAEKARDRILARLSPAIDFVSSPPDFSDPDDFVASPSQ